MIYEPGTMECRILIDAKDKLMDVQVNLAGLKNTAEMISQLKEIHANLEYMHEELREKNHD